MKNVEIVYFVGQVFASMMVIAIAAGVLHLVRQQYLRPALLVDCITNINYRGLMRKTRVLHYTQVALLVLTAMLLDGIIWMPQHFGVLFLIALAAAWTCGEFWVWAGRLRSDHFHPTTDNVPA